MRKEIAKEIAMPNWPHTGFEPRIVYITQSDSFRCLVRKLPDGEFRSLSGPNGTFTTPDQALSAAASSVTALLVSRKEALAIEVVRLLSSTPARLKPATIPDPGGSGVNVRYWQAQSDSGTWTDPLPTPYEATRVALGRANGDST